MYVRRGAVTVHSLNVKFVNVDKYFPLGPTKTPFASSAVMTIGGIINVGMLVNTLEAAL